MENLSKNSIEVASENSNLVYNSRKSLLFKFRLYLSTFLVHLLLTVRLFLMSQ